LAKREKQGKTSLSPNASSFASFVVGLFLLVALFASSSVWVTDSWSPSQGNPSFLMCNVDVCEFTIDEVTSNTTGLQITRLQILVNNSSKVYVTNELMPTDIISAGTIQWSDGSTEALFKKEISNGRYVITKSYMLNLTQYGLPSRALMPVVEDSRSTNLIDEMLTSNQVLAKMFLGLLLVVSCSLLIVPSLRYIEIKTSTRKKKE
jgi:hypothetical protein